MIHLNRHKGLQVMYSPRLTGARGLSHGHIFTRDGWLVQLAKLSS